MSTTMDLGRLRVLRRLGSGGFATVWLAHDPLLDSLVAVKVLADNWAHHADVRERFLGEARLLRRVDSDSVVRVYDIGELTDGRPWFSMTYATGGTLAERLPWTGTTHEGQALLHELGAAVQVLHGHAVVHRDLSPTNIMFVDSPDGERVVLGDLGLAKDLGFASGLTMPGGTGAYRAPEQREVSSDVSPATDVYALAVNAGHVLGPELGPATSGLLQLARSSQIEQRPQTPQDFLEELDSALAADTPAPPSTPPPSQVRPDPATSPTPTRRPQSSLIAVVLLGFAVAAIAAILLWPSGASSRILTPEGTASVIVPGTWEAHEVADVPGAQDSDGLIAYRDEASITLAHTEEDVAAATIADATSHTDCSRGESRQVTANQWQGSAVTWIDCPSGETRSEVGLNGPDGAGSVYLAIVAQDGSPELGPVVETLDVEIP